MGGQRTRRSGAEKNSPAFVNRIFGRMKKFCYSKQNLFGPEPMARYRERSG